MKPSPLASVTRRKFLGTVAAASAAVSFPAVLRGAEKKSRQPNVLFLMADDMRVELGCYASRFGAKTPNLDALAKSGVRFDRNYCQFPLCNPSRASLLTGRRPSQTGVLGNRTDFRKAHPDWTTLPQLFGNHGYATMRAGKIYHGGIDDAKSWNTASDQDHPTDDGSGPQVGRTKEIPRAQIPQPDGVLPPLPADNARSAYSDRVVILGGNGEGHGDYHAADRTIENLHKHKDEPFFIAGGLIKPHSPPTAPEKFFDLYDPEKIKLPPDFAAWPTVPAGFPSAAIRKRNADLFIGRGASEAEAKEVIRAYLASLSWADWNFGRILGELDALGLRENTIIVMVVDHGYQLGEKGKWSKAGSLFEMGTRVPLIISAPGMKGYGQSCHRIVESLDIYPTIAELAGLTPEKGVEGTSLVPLLKNPTAKWDKPAYSIWSEDGQTAHGVAVRTEQWRYAEYGAHGAHGAMLLDPKDADELKNFADAPEHQAVVAQLSALTRKYAASYGSIS
jgi:arylsulfatase A-like enzyme